jgi:hypothetical protein
MATISKVIPRHTKTVQVRWAKPDFMEMSDGYREVRSKLRKPMDTCHWCRHKFANGEMMALVCLERGGNKVFCQDCCAQITDE